MNAKVGLTAMVVGTKASFIYEHVAVGTMARMNATVGHLLYNHVAVGTTDRTMRRWVT